METKFVRVAHGGQAHFVALYQGLDPQEGSRYVYTFPREFADLHLPVPVVRVSYWQDAKWAQVPGIQRVLPLE